MIAQYGRVVNSTNHGHNNNRDNLNVHSTNHDSSRYNNKGAIINVTKAAARKSILMQITKVRAANGFP
jgi:hypothetical protein